MAHPKYCFLTGVTKLNGKPSGMDSSCKEKKKVHYNMGPEMLNYRVIRPLTNGSTGLKFETLVAIESVIWKRTHVHFFSKCIFSYICVD